jgi:general stress protein YciG
MANTHSSSDKHSGSPANQKASPEGKKGVTQEQVGSGKEHDPDNFANNPDRAAAAGHKGGKHSHDRD